MAKTTGSRAGGEGGNSKIRFIMLEADLNGGDLTQITHAISNALRPVVAPQSPRLIGGQVAPPVTNGAGANAAEQVESAEQIESEAPIETVSEGAPAQAPKSQRSRKFREPQIVNGLDLTGNGVPWVQFAKEKSPSTRTKRFLTAMAWFKNHGGKPAIGIDEVYTAFRTPGVNWPYSFNDYDGVFRGLVKSDLAERKAPGQYAINLVGEGKVDAKGDD